MTRSSRGRRKTTRTQRRAKAEARQRATQLRKLAATVDHQGNESHASALYTAGHTVKYTSRIKGPTYGVQTYDISELPEDSALRRST